MRKWKCIKSYKSGEYLTKGKIYTEDNCKFIYDDGWTSNWWDYNSSHFDKNDAMSNYLESFDEEMKSTQEYDLRKEKVAVLCDTKDKIREIYKIYGGHPREDIFACYNPSKLYIAWDDDENKLTWDSLSGYFEQHDYKLITFEEFKGEDKMKFKVGDRVKVTNDNWGVGLKDKIGTIVDVDNEHSEGGIGIEFENFKGGHECGGHAKSRQGWYYPVKNIELVSLSNNQKSIHITFSENSTHAVLKDGNNVIKQSTVGLYHKDEYKFEVGVMEVVKKLLDIKDEVVDECEECKPKFVKANLGDKIRIIKNNMEHSPSIKIGDEFIVGYVGDDCVYNCKYWGNGNVLLDSDEEYEIIEESTNQLSDYTVDELLSEIKLRMEK